MNREIAELREVIQKLVPMLTGRGLRVTQRGSQAYVKSNAKTKKPELVNIPSISDNAEPSFVRAIQGFIDHEVAHVLITDFNYYGGENLKPSDLAKPEVQRFMNLHNIVEDTMIEREIVKTFPGSQRNIGQLRDHFIERITKPAVASAKDDKERFIYIMVPMMRALAGHREFIDFMDHDGHWQHPMVDAFVKALPEETLRALKTCRSTKETLAISRVVEGILYPPAPPPPPAPPTPDQNQSDDQGDNDDEGQSQDKPEKKAEEGDGDGERDHSEVEEGEEEDDGKGGKSAREDEAAGEDAEEDDGTAGAEKDAEEDTEDDGDGPADEDAGDDDGEDPADADGDEPENGDGAEPDDGSDGAPDDSNGNGDDGDADDGNDETADEGADGGDPDGDEAAGGGSDDDAEGNGSEYQPGEDEGVIVSEERDGAQNLESESGETADSQGGVGGDDPGKSMFDFADDAFEAVDISKALALEISRQAIEDIRASDYTVFTRDMDRIEVLKPPAAMEQSWVVSLDEETRTMTGRMQKDIERIMASQAHVVRVPGQRSGKLHAASLYRVPQGDPRVFTIKEETVSKNTAVSLLVDNSGSMHGAKMRLAMIAAYALASTLDRVKIPNELLGYTTGEDSRMSKDMREAYSDDLYRNGIRWDRVSPIVMPIYKTFDERITSEVKKRIAYAANAQVGLNFNVDGESLEYAALRLAQRSEKRKVIIVLSDGQPSAGAKHCAHLKYMVDRLEKAGIECVGIGIMDASVKRFYPKHVVMNNVGELPGLVMREIKKILA